MGFTFSFFGLLQVWHSKDIDQKKRIRRYFIIALVIFLALTIVSFFLESFFHWFYVITILFFSFTVTPLNANLRILHWSNYVNSKFILSILGYADHIGAIILTIGIVFKTLQWPFANLLIGIGVALLSIAAVVWNIQFRKSIDYKILIENELKEKNKEILDSIQYAKRIQSAILPSTSIIKQALKNSFILYKPKDIVSGDFYWIEQKNDKVFFAAADCTGHGVPGAMVSVICNNALNRSVREFDINSTSEILNNTRELVIKEFEKSEEEVKDGMDIAICMLEGNILYYSGAYNPLWIIRDNEIIETKADRQPIGKFDFSRPFTSHQFKLEPGDTFYIFTDGFPDQFGGKDGKKFKNVNLKKLISSIQEHSMEEQKEILNKAFEEWRGPHEQIDDVCIIGVRFNN